jgi:hypothetical protein
MSAALAAGVVGLTLTLVIGGGPAGAKPQRIQGTSTDTVSHSVTGNPAKTQGYWTYQRMRGASPA